MEHVQLRPFLEAAIPGFLPAFASDDFLVHCRAAQEGIGTLSLPGDQAERYGLVKLDVALPELTAKWYVVCAKSARNIPRVQAVFQTLMDVAKL